MVAILKQAEDDFCRKYVACSTEGAWIKLSKELANISKLFFSYEEDAYIQNVLPMCVGYYTKMNIQEDKKMTKRERKVIKNKKSLHKAALKVKRWRKRRLWWRSRKEQVMDKIKITTFAIVTIVVTVVIGIWVLNSTPDTYTRGVYKGNALVGHEHVVNGEVVETCYGPCHSNQ